MVFKRLQLGVEDMLGVEPDDWQQEVLYALAQNRLVSVRSGQGVGKMALESWTIIWFLCCRPYLKVICTALTRFPIFYFVKKEGWSSAPSFLF
ncbi:hypothetical protein B5G50_08225 [Brevibacillus brevis]|nr:hypothetical protein B5G50_08225 [Brevibacillus brevis]